MIFPTQNVYTDYSTSYVNLSSSYVKIYGEASNKLSSLTPSFVPYAQHILNFIDHWCKTNSEYKYELICTRRSWHSQKKVTTINDDEKNGLSWYLYGNAISINVYKAVQNKLFEGGDVGDSLHESLNFNDGSAKKFIVDAQEWFINNPISINGSSRTLKIFGIYPNLSKCINVPISTLFSKYLHDEDVIYWGGIFSSGSNFSHWEWHPGYMPNEIWKIREDFLNNAFYGFDFDSLFDEEIQGTTFVKKFLSGNSEIIEEDFLSLIKLKIKINLSKEYSILDLFNWAKDNPRSLNQMINFYKISGDYNNYNLFQIINAMAPFASISYDIEGNLILLAGGLLSAINTDQGTFYYEFYNEFGEKIQLPSDTTYILPVDHKLLDIDFNLTELNIDEDFKPAYSDTMSDVSMAQVIKNIDDTANLNPNVKFDINEHGMLGDISIMPEKLLTLEEMKNMAMKQYVFEEMITPPNQVIISSTKNPRIIDLNKLLVNKNVKISNKVDEMINPSELS